jgi:pyruvate,orthophosphate dikinase
MGNLVTLNSHVWPAEKVGGKAANISKMLNMGLPVPLGFTAETSHTFELDFESGEKFETGSTFAIRLNSHIRWLAQETDCSWNSDEGKPLIVSVRSGAPISMPGMMDTILNVGLTKRNMDRFIHENGASRQFALDCYRRLIQMFATTVKGVDPVHFSTVFDAANIYYREDFTEEVYELIVSLYEKIYEEQVGESFPDNPNVQLLEACNAVFSSWFSEKAKSYRSIENISDKLGTSVTVQQMVFGNLERSATGVVFTHNPNTGEKGIYGDFLTNAQGEDVVAGTHKVMPIKDIFKDTDLVTPAKKLQAVMARLLDLEKDILDIEFTIERGELYLLQYRIAKRSQRASVRTIIDMAREGEISASTATEKFLNLLPKTDSGSDDPGNLKYLGKGIGATEGTVVGRIAIGHEQADKFTEDGEPYIYVAMETNPEDSVQMKNSVGILTALGGKLSHAAVVARGWGKSCVVSLEGMEIESEEHFVYNGVTYPNGSWLKINGSTGEVWA